MNDLDPLKREVVSSGASEEFVEDPLVRCLRAVHVVCGFNFRSGGQLVVLLTCCSANPSSFCFCLNFAQRPVANGEE